MSVRIAVSGACGRMGRAIGRLAVEDRSLAVAEALSSPGSADLGKDYGTILGREALGVDVSERLAGKADVLVDFSTPAATVQRLGECVRRKIPMVIGTTGFTDGQKRMVAAAARKIACVMSSNMSVGVNVLFRIAPEIAKLLGPGYDLDIVDIHHRFKKDAPSGTARTLAGRLARAAGRAARIVSIRSGDAVGEHRILFGSIGDSVELVHRAGSRDIFALGALRAAKWIAKRRPGLYTMLDVLSRVKP